MTAIRQPASRPRRRAAGATQMPYINRELSWLEFNARVLYEAQDERNPLLERTRFLAIFASNLDEFFQVRVAGLKQQVSAGRSNPTPDGLSAAETLDAVRNRLLPLVAEHSAAYARIRDELAEEEIRIVRYEERPERHLELRSRFLDEIFPVLTPLAVDPGHPFPYISDLSLSLAVTVRDPLSGERRFARVKVPPILPRLIEVGQQT
ncbi:MAG TPA: RNA degradosome polyphosphate kinase, partial [Candidatus Limnocylindria bacterium]|nr:RNA degradosome polyphosphate kinase [Candidatus Limnocylindria bacterium]